MAFIPIMFDAFNKSLKQQMEQMPSEVFAWMTEPNYPRTNNCPFFSHQQAQSTNENVEEETGNVFKVNLDVHEFRPEDITVKVEGNIIYVEAKHKERKDEQGSISRHVMRKYNLPEGFDINKVSSKLSTDGFLCIIVPSIQAESQARKIKVVQTGRPAREDEKKTEENNGEKKDGGNIETRE